MKKDEKEKKFFVEESPKVSKVSAINSGRKKFNFKQVISQSKKVIAFGRPYHIYLYLSLFGVFAGTFTELMMPVY